MAMMPLIRLRFMALYKCVLDLDVWRSTRYYGDLFSDATPPADRDRQLRYLDSDTDRTSKRD